MTQTLWPAILLPLLSLADAQGGHLGWPSTTAGPAPYSPRHYRAPTLHKWKLLRNAAPAPGPIDSYPWVPSSVDVLRYSCPSVNPAYLYLNSGLPYDPAGPFMNRPVIVPSTLPATR